MSERADNNQYVRRVVLPSGKTIEVVYFEEHPALPAATSGTALESASYLHVCGACESVCPVSAIFRVSCRQLPLVLPRLPA